MTDKRFGIPGDKIRRLVRPMGSAYATDRIMVDGKKIGYMYREPADDEYDSGWRFFSGDEEQSYVDNPSNLARYEVNTVANYDPDIIPYLETPAPCAFEKVSGTSEYLAVEVPPAL